jgi:hypothetical protein
MHAIKRLLAVSTALAGAATVLTFGAAGSAFASSCEEVPPVIDSVTVTPNPLTLTSNYAKTIYVIVDAHDEGGYDSCANDYNGGYGVAGVADVTVDLYGVDEWDYAHGDATLVSGDTESGRWRVPIQLDKDASLGLWRADVTVDDANYNETEDKYAAYFRVKHATKFVNFNAGPEPAHKGKPVTLSGNVKRLASMDDFSSGYIPAAVRVDYYFRRSGGSSWTHLGFSTSTHSTGHFAKTFTARYSGTWQVRFNGSGKYSPSHASDGVRVVA